MGGNQSVLHFSKTDIQVESTRVFTNYTDFRRFGYSRQAPLIIDRIQVLMVITLLILLFSHLSTYCGEFVAVEILKQLEIERNRTCLDFFVTRKSCRYEDQQLTLNIVLSYVRKLQYCARTRALFITGNKLTFDARALV